ncbi:phage shock protein A [Paenibacillus sp. 598K]|uniref:PspA/IM30 family protein n=1 Tax=Paenibacillus sp. 598K TaxID=1117987 RepID=UPI000FF9CEB8|nr:PspA/IM30 family protein [Paenibacillus sp. 598K]GBF72422.1 phage shock protein A [Paenibacillus sp. 598K]
MGILSRFRDIMRSNVNAWFNKEERPDQTIDHYMRTVQRDLGQVKAESTALQTEVSRTKRAWDECRSEVNKLQRYAERSMDNGDEDAALRFLEQKTARAAKEPQLKAAYELASTKAEKMSQLEEKLVADVRQLEVRQTELKRKLADTQAQQRYNEQQAGGASLKQAEAKINQAYDEAVALAELRSEQESDLDELFADLERQMATESPAADPQQELATLKMKVD